jgi:hypothetical protein
LLIVKIVLGDVDGNSKKEEIVEALSEVEL